MNDYLRSELGIPAHHIVNLRDQEATRDAILRELRALQIRVTPRKGDTIIVYYAGYGASSEAPNEWRSENQRASFIVPHDGLVNDPGGCYVYPIPDRTINALLYELSLRKDTNGEGGDIVSGYEHAA